MALPNIIQNHTNDINTIKSTYLPLAGGTLTGAINFANNTWNTVGDDAYFGDCNIAGCVGVKGKNGETGVNFISKDGTTSSKLCISGSNLTINGNTIITSAGGTMSSSLRRDGVGVSWRTILDNSPQSSFLYQNTYAGYMPALNLKTKDGRVGIGTYENYLALTYFLDTNTTNGANTQLNLLSNGTATIGGKQIVCMTKWTSGTSGYRIYSDGFIEQWGRVTTTTSSGTVTFHIAFSNTNYSILCQEGEKPTAEEAGSDTAGYGENIGLTNYTTTTVRYTCVAKRYFNWFACGY
jgi:hypothetical protein